MLRRINIDTGTIGKSVVIKAGKWETDDLSYYSGYFKIKQE